MDNKEFISEHEAVKLIRSGNRVFIHGSAATPVCLVKAMLQRYFEMTNIELVSITNMGDLDFCTPEFEKSFFFNAYISVLLGRRKS